MLGLYFSCGGSWESEKFDTLHLTLFVYHFYIFAYHFYISVYRGTLPMKGSCGVSITVRYQPMVSTNNVLYFIIKSNKTGRFKGLIRREGGIEGGPGFCWRMKR